MRRHPASQCWCDGRPRRCLNPITAEDMLCDRCRVADGCDGHHDNPEEN